MAERQLRLGSRGSPLALAQAKLVAEALGEAEIVPIRTAGDEASADRGASARTPPAPPGGDKARFVREIEAALLAGEIDIAVHSAKDLPSELPDGLRISGVPPREDPLDAWVGPGTSLDGLPEGARVGTASLRRRAQLLAIRPDLEVGEIRGNVDTRLRKLGEGACDGLVLAAAGLLRLGRGEEICFRFEAAQMVPAPGQGTLALQTRAGDERARAATERIGDPSAAAELSAERSAVAELGASCDTPLGVSARHRGGALRLSGFCGLPDGSEWIRDEVEVEPGEPERLGRLLAERMRGAGADELLARAERIAGASGAGT